MGVVNFSSAQQYISKFENKMEREKLLSTYLSLPYQVIHDSPTLKHYTDWNKFDNLSLEVKDSDETKVSKQIEDYKTIVVDNGLIKDSNVTISDSPYNELIKPEEHKLVALTLALSRKIRITSREFKKVLVYHTSSIEKTISPLNLEVEIKEGDELDLIYFSESKLTSMTSSVISLKVSKDSILNLYVISLSPYVFLHMKAEVEGTVNNLVFSSKSIASHINYNIELKGNSSSTFTAKAIGIDDDNIDIRINVNHIGSNSRSEGMLKAISADNALTVIRGDATIFENAYDSSTSILGRAFIIGKEAKAVVAPMLEVKTGRVKLAKHSASVSKVPEDLIFYLESRGFSRKEAESMIIKGFISDENDPQFLSKIIDEILTESKVILSV
ncbi:MAG: SufD family Fe-S cluster assembly protein [Sulfolobus sp.]